MKSANGLYPIIRRVRRPLLPVDPREASRPVPVDSEKPQVTTPDNSNVTGEKKTDAEDPNK
jgi:hypothetical protein